MKTEIVEATVLPVNAGMIGEEGKGEECAI